MNSTRLLERLSVAAFERADVERRALWMELLAEADASQLEFPSLSDSTLEAVAAALAEMLAEQQGCQPPAWTASVGPVSDEVFLTTRHRASARDRLRAQSPAPLRRRNLFAPAKYVQLV